MAVSRVSFNLLVLSAFMILFGVSGYLGYRASYDPTLSQQALTAIAISIGVYFVSANLGRYENAAWLMAGLVVVAGAVFAAYFISQFDYQNYPETPALILALGRATTFLPKLSDFYVHPNAAATLFETLLPIGVTLIIGSRHWLQRVLWLLTVTILVYASFLTYSRGSWVALAAVIGIAFYLFLVLRVAPDHKTFISIGAIMMILIGILIVVVLSPRLPFLANTLGTAESRLTLYRNSLYLAGDYPFTGIGLGETFGLVYSRFSLLIFVPFLTYSHNLPLAVWLGQGLPGIIAFFGIVICFYAYVIRVIRHQHQDKHISPLFYGAFLGATATLLHGLTDARQYTESPWIMPSLFFAFGLTVANGAQVFNRLHDKGLIEPRSWIVPLGFGWALILIIAGAVLIMNQTIRVAWEVNQGALAETRGDSIIQPTLSDAERAQFLETAKGHYRVALALDPAQPNANRRLGNLLVNEETFGEGVGLLEKAVIGEPDNPAAVKGLGLAYVWVGRTRDAARTLMKLEDTTALQNELYSWAQFRQDSGRPLWSAYALETVLLMDESNPDPNLDVWLLTGDRFREGGDQVRARTWYENILRRDASNERAQAALEALN